MHPSVCDVKTPIYQNHIKIEVHEPVYCITIKGQKELLCGAKLHMYIRSIQLLKVVGILEQGI